MKSSGFSTVALGLKNLLMADHHGQSSPSTYDIKETLQIHFPNRTDNRLPQNPLLLPSYLPVVIQASVANVSAVPSAASGTCEVASSTTYSNLQPPAYRLAVAI